MHDHHGSIISGRAAEKHEVYKFEFALSGIEIFFNLKFDGQFLGDWPIEMQGVVRVLKDLEAT